MKIILLQQYHERDYLASKNYLKRHVEINIDNYVTNKHT